MPTSPVRVRFAPSPTGFMHLGNVRTALINYLYAKHYQGTFIIRIEDTDQQRNFDAGAQQILADLAWLGLSYDEGPRINGPHTPYYQSERDAIYQEYVEKFKQHNKIYRCFCTQEELEVKRERLIAQKLPPRYDRTCLRLSPQEIQTKLDAHIPYIWRFKLPDTTVTITDLARGPIVYDLKHFSDFAITRQDGSFTFIFANFVDDVTMNISHVIRGEDHLSNTANQAALYAELGYAIPTFWHLPILVNTEGKKLSKRDFGFSLNDLRKAGYLPQAIINYLAFLGGSYQQEIATLDELVTLMKFDTITSTGQIKYDTEKLAWLNHKWIQKLSLPELVTHVEPYVTVTDRMRTLLALLQPELVTLADCVEKVKFLQETPRINAAELSPEQQAVALFIKTFTQEHELLLARPDEFVTELTQQARANKLAMKPLFELTRTALTGQAHGLSIKDILTILGRAESYKRLTAL